MQTSILSPRSARSFARPENRVAKCSNINNQHITQNNRAPLNVLETEDSFLLQVAAPGFSKDQVTITEKENILTITMKRSDQANTNYTHREFGNHEASIVIRLPQQLDLNTLTATVLNGVVSVAVAKKAEAKPKVINVQ